MRVAALLTLTLMAVLSCTNPPPTSPKPAQILIAGEFPIERDGGLGATDASRAVEIAIANHPVVGGYRLTYKPLDDSLSGVPSQDKAVQNAIAMVRESRILGVVGPWNSLIARSVISVMGQANLAVLSPSTTLDCLTARPSCVTGSAPPSNFFRIAASDYVAVRAEADLAIRRLGLKRFAVITDGQRIYGAPVGAAFAAEVVADGGAVVFRQTFSQTDQSYDPMLRQAKLAGAEAVFVGGFDMDGACRVRAAMKGVFPSDAYFFSGDGIVTRVCLSDAGAGADDHLVAAVSARQPAAVRPELQSLRNTGFIDGYVFAAYDCAEIMIAAIEKAIKDSGGEIPTREQVLAAVAATQEFKGLTGTFTFNANGDATRPAVSLYHVRNGIWTFWQNL